VAEPTDVAPPYDRHPSRRGGSTLDRDRKAALRASALSARRELGPSERQQAAEAVVARLRWLPELRRARTVLLYAALADELDVGGLVGPLRAAGVRTLFPRVRGDRLELVAASDLLTLTLGYRGVQEPAGPAIDPAVVEAAVVPGVAFDLRGTRLGHGGGHYDRLLAGLPAGCARVGTCFSCQLVPAVPREPHDQPVDLIVTERATHRPARPPADAAR
jgi:5-formyltetrahydrofolate cyclo-ligase